MKSLSILCLFATVCGTFADFRIQCRDCICRAEGCESNAFQCNGQTPEACGPYQISLSYYCDAQNYPANLCFQYETEWRNCMNTWDCNNQTVDGYRARYGVSCTQLADPTCEHYSKIHKGGPGACFVTTGAPATFWQSVNNCCNTNYPGQC